jgi:5-methylcytosine-specific restriction endonuclease McrA
MIRKRTDLSKIQVKIFDVIISHPEGISLQDIRKELGNDGGNQEQLGRRLRSLKPFYKVKTIQKGTNYLYTIVKEVEKGKYDYEVIDKKLRAEILIRYGQKCQMCGRSPSKDDITLHIDHRIPRNWGGKTIRENLWPLCSACNEGKKDYFSTFDTKIMKKILSKDSVHERIAELLSLKKGKWVDSDIIEFVANFNDYQADWQKRLRELRYLGWIIEVGKIKEEKRVKSRYKLVQSTSLPKDPSKAAREYEKNRAIRNLK